MISFSLQHFNVGPFQKLYLKTLSRVRASAQQFDVQEHMYHLEARHLTTLNLKTNGCLIPLE